MEAIPGPESAMNMLAAVPLASVLWFPAAPCPVPQEGARFGTSVALADVNGDSFGDVIVGEPYFDGSKSAEGRVLVYLGSPGGPSPTPAWIRDGVQARAHFGAAVANAGDVDGDGFDDIVVGAPDYDAPRALRTAGPARHLSSRDSGAIAVFLGSPTGLEPTPALFRAGVEDREHFGRAVAGAGDVDGDGFDDVLVGATGTGANLGGAFVFHGSAIGAEPFPRWIALGPQPDERFGFSVDGGDLDADGCADVLVGAPDGGTASRGEVHVYSGSRAGLGTTPQVLASSIQQNVDFGHSVAWLGDVDGDGFGDAAVGDPFADFQFDFDNGWLRHYRGSAAGLVLGAVQSAGGSDVQFGFAIARAGDVDGDSLADWIVGKPRLLGSSAGLWDVYGSCSPLLCLIGFTNGQEPGGRLGYAVAGGADVDGDGFDDVVIGEPWHDRGAALDAGRVHVHRGTLQGVGSDPDWILLAP
jgi:hypothetical protein